MVYQMNHGEVMFRLQEVHVNKDVAKFQENIISWQLWS